MDYGETKVMERDALIDEIVELMEIATLKDANCMASKEFGRMWAGKKTHRPKRIPVKQGFVKEDVKYSKSFLKQIMLAV